FSMGNIGNIYAEQGSYDLALKNFKKTAEIAEEIGDKNTAAATKGNIAKININLGDSSLLVKEKMQYYSQAVEYAEQALEIAKEIDALPLENEQYDRLHKAWANLGNYQKAYEYSNLYNQTRDSLFSDEKTRAITEMQTKYETEKKQQEIENQQLLIEKQEIDNKRQRAQRNFFIGGSVLLAIMVLLIFLGYQQKKQANTIITHKNVLLEEANEEIRAQKEEIEAQRDMVVEQKERIEIQTKHITDSISYAQRIQNAVLPRSSYTQNILGEHFILFKPKDIVSGDFFWATRINHWLVFTVADCTGHGVPGAFMSMLGVSYLKDIVNKKEVTKASNILELMRESVIDALQQRDEENEQHDGLDIAICVLNTKNNQLQFAGANNPLYIVNARKELQIIKPDKQPVAIHQVMKPFTNHEIKVNKGDSIYITSDGFQDQFGGPQKSKFMVKNLRILLASNVEKPMAEQKVILEEVFDSWKGENPQIDDVTIMGVRV
ncbi:MAG: SpoIIE family protein phosphatase, partial [Perlabentimonas sp.]